ncbi:succinate-semialdehyde dehydrogenase [Aminobacter sp. Y103A]|uniref:Mll6142 protein n=1 Tax=Mesorhizobium japonicum (strain LMG 29417 / CECT 9101 / MAFF 303099) TaxID=266835 RepID=Q98A57_RHILO|nr:mll6142 [Mesorhizobium japonicum MAFF 303099]BBD36310.1 succinate-semialdehyde dehydrogenase [Aminobacter sp. SS-2016]
MPPLGTPPGERIFEVLIHPLATCWRKFPDMGSRRRAAVDQAYMAQAGWAAMTARECCDMLWRWHQLIIDHAVGLAAILDAEMGEPLAKPVRSPSRGPRICIGTPKANRVYGETISPALVGPAHAGGQAAGRRCCLDGRAQDPAGAGGGLRGHPQTAEQTPLVVAGAMIALAAEAGFPEGFVNLIYACKGDAIGRS